MLIYGPMADENFGGRLARIMGDKRLSIAELARLSDVHYVLISGYLKGDRRGRVPSLSTLLKLARALRVSLEELTGLPALKGAEDALVKHQPSADALRLAEIYDALPDDDWLKKAIEERLLGLKGESDEKAQGKDGTK